jgi:hypothetical protein
MIEGMTPCGQNWMGRKGQAEQGRQKRVGRIKTARTVQYCLDRIAKTKLPGQDCQDNAAST